MSTVLPFIILFGTCFAVTLGACDRDNGPSGAYECVAFAKYNNVSQWATCLTDIYIQAKSKSFGQNHQCEDRTRTYCYYQCMCESYDNCDGPTVNSACACDPNKPQKSTTTLTPRTTLSPWCFSPDGKTCSWYRDCLEQRYPCEGTEAAYAITYAEKFCDLYTDHYKSFSTDGQIWIDGVRECLQVTLVPLLRHWMKPTCSDIKNIAFASHANCYTGPASGGSFCSLSLVDKWRVFLTIKGAFIDSFVETMKGLWDTMRQCGSSLLHNHMTLARINVKRKDVIDINPNAFAGKIVDWIADKEKWGDRGITWFGYSGSLNASTNQTRPSAASSESEFQIDIILAPKQEFDLNAQPNVTKANATEAAITLASSVRDGFLRLSIDGNRVDGISMVACFDVDCNTRFIDVLSNAGTTSRLSRIFIFLVGILILFITHL